MWTPRNITNGQWTEHEFQWHSQTQAKSSWLFQRYLSQFNFVYNLFSNSDHFSIFLSLLNNIVSFVTSSISITSWDYRIGFIFCTFSFYFSSFFWHFCLSPSVRNRIFFLMLLLILFLSIISAKRDNPASHTYSILKPKWKQKGITFNIYLLFIDCVNTKHVQRSVLLLRPVSFSLSLGCLVLFVFFPKKKHFEALLMIAASQPTIHHVRTLLREISRAIAIWLSIHLSSFSFSLTF